MWVGGNTDTFSEQRFRSRVRAVSVFFATGYAIIMLRLFYLQVVKGNDLAQASEMNRTQIILLRAPRGDFFDHKGRALVLNRPSWSLMYSVPEKSDLSKDLIAKKLTPFLTESPALWTKRLDKAFKSKQMVRLAEDVPDRVAFLMKEMENDIPGLRVVMEFRRGYPLGVYAKHLIGYLGEVNERELKEEGPTQRKLGDLIGKMGLERIDDEKLRGREGGMLIEIDSIGRLKRIIKELPFQKGKSLQLTLDLDIQKAAEDGIAQTETKRGAAVAIDVNTGAILAWASAPSFDPTGSMVEDLKDPGHPFLDRVYRGAYPPGSIFKIITAAAGFEQSMIRTTEQTDCVGYVSLTDTTGNEKKYKCWKAHGWVDYWRAMAESCDSYFYLLGKRLGSQSIYDIGNRFGFGQTTQDFLSSENKGTLPNPMWKRRMGLGGWSTGDTLNMAIGQGFVTATPLQIVTMMAGVATGGTCYRPYVVEKILDADGTVTNAPPPRVLRTVQLKDTTWSAIDRSLHGVVTWGTGAATRIAHLEVYGKTGTAQNPHGDDHAWFAGYAGYVGERPSVAVCVFIENGGHGGAVAAPIVRKMLEIALPPKPVPVPATAAAVTP